ncbi:vascular endothelial growth factor receptor 1-like isoform X2 [Eupeodes corollae]|uniref:vascular endothelial growth factor receptor 1-like isoform X2 n=1 Tax=Eupeodes corollae TaxID=290404 RepID=UPI002493B1EB|nr:vascular endothelial growth factor receptor 1-like isoform X2 [Eupeodes corollae]
MGLPGPNYAIVLWSFVFLFSSCYAFPKPQSNFEDDNEFAYFAAKRGAPLITPTLADVVLDFRSNYTLRCESKEPITWRPFPSSSLELNSSPYNTLDNDKPYGSMLYLTDVTAEYVGYFYCIKERELNEEADFDMMVEDYKAAKIYIFVNDENTLLVPMSVPIINANQYEDIVIPCKPTMPDTVVELITSDQQVYSSETSGRYDPKRGFVVQIQKLSEAGHYSCRPQQPSPENEEEELYFVILYSGNESNDRELAPICDVFPINNRNNRNNTINCTVFASEIPLKIKNNNNYTLSSLSPVNNTHFFSQSNNNKNDNNTNPSDILSVVDVVNPVVVVVSRKSRSSSPSSTLTLTTARPTTRHYQQKQKQQQQQSSVGDRGRGASRHIDTTESNGGHDSDNIDDDGEADVDVDDDDSGENGEINGGGEDVKNSDTTTRKYYGLGRKASALSTSNFEFTVTTESSYGVRMGKRHTTSSNRGRSHKSYGSGTPRPRSKTTHVAKPQIHSNLDGHAVEGETFNLTCSVETSFDVRFLMRWETPLDKNSLDRLSYTNATIDHNEKTRHIGKSFLTVTNAQKSDEGFYKCIVQDHSGNIAHNTYLMTILKSGESYINMSEPNNYYTIKTNASKNIMMNVNYRGFPMPRFNWYAPEGKLIQPSKKYEINKTNSSISLQINFVELFDTGDYVLKASNGVDEKELKFTLYVKAKPQVSIENVYVQAGEQARLLCKTHAYPIAKIIWNYTACNISPKWPSCKNEPVTFNSTRNSSETSKIERINELIFKPDRPGKMQCTAINEQGISSNEGYVLIGDITDNMTVYGVDENLQIAKGDEVIITCAALAYYYSADLDWFKDNQMITNSSGVEIKTTFSDYSYKKTIKFKNIEDEHAGSYECRARRVDNDVDFDSKFLSIIVHEPAAPVMVQTNLGDQHKRALGESLELVCKSEGIPKASITWYKDDEKLNAGKNVLILEDNSVLKIPYIKPNDEGLYKCVASNRLGDAESSSQVKITNMPGLKTGWIIAIVVFMGILIISVILLVIRVLKEREVMRQMKLAGLANFEEGALEQINPAMSLDEQADLLPYDRRFEFPRHKLKLGKKLGAGAFGVVLKAHAEGIIPEENETVVAVKMVKRTADNEVIKALVSELKIMVHLGQHLNVVNLLGAVTKNIAKREVMVIVEYCRYGNVQNFLLRNRKRFINQINPITDKIDPTIVEQRFSGGDFELNRNSENDPRSGTRAGRPNSSNYLRQSDLYEGHVDSCATEQTVMTTVPEGEDQVMSNNSVQPAWRSNYKPDSTEAMSINTSDLVSWAFQVARGMDYLSSRKVLHGDLAARNILLCDDNVVKICDFGLARSMYKNDNYKKQGEAPLPIKWLALESLSDQVFSTYTDVWSFGIVLWEFFSLAKVPYPGMDANQTLYLKLKDGYRMEKPPYANEELYDIMLECWSANPESRPLFHELEKKFARLLGDEVTSHYVDLNEPYLKINTEHQQQSETDYLALMGSPDEMAPPPPRYVNGMILPEIRIDPSDDYLQMSTKTGSAIFSPRPNDDYVKADNFTFSEQHSPTISNNLDSPVTKNRKKVGVPPEEIPMLQKSSNGINQTSGSQSDSETEQSPDAKSAGKTFAQITRRPIEKETSLIDTTDGNYVNVKAATDLSKKFMNSNGTKDAFSNPSYLMLKSVNEGRK